MYTNAKNHNSLLLILAISMTGCATGGAYDLVEVERYPSVLSGKNGGFDQNDTGSMQPQNSLQGKSKIVTAIQNGDSTSRIYFPSKPTPDNLDNVYGALKEVANSKQVSQDKPESDMNSDQWDSKSDREYLDTLFCSGDSLIDKPAQFDCSNLENNDPVLVNFTRSRDGTEEPRHVSMVQSDGPETAREVILDHFGYNKPSFLQTGGCLLKKAAIETPRRIFVGTFRFLTRSKVESIRYQKNCLSA